MRLLELEIENVQRFVGVHKLSLQRGLSFITAENRDFIRQDKGDSNGSGKTAIIRAICWCLFGKTWDGKRAGKLVADDREGGTAMRVRITISGGYVIERIYYRGKQRVSFTTPETTHRDTSEEDEKGEDTSIVDAEIRKHLKIDLKLFSSCLYVSRTSTSVQFLYATPAERAKLLSHMVDDQVFQHAAKMLKTHKTNLETRYTKNKTEQELLQAKLAKEERSIEALQTSIEKAQEAEEQRKSKIREQLAELQTQMQELSTVLAEKADVSMDVLEQQRADIKARLSRNQEALLNCKIISEHNITPGTKCSLCLSTITAAHQEYVLSHNEEVRTTHKTLRQEQLLWARELESLELRQEQLRALALRRAKAEPKLAELRHRHAHLKVDLGQRSLDLAVYQDRMAGHHAAVSDCRTRLVELASVVQDLSEEIYTSGQLARMFSTEVRNMMFDRIRGILEHLTAQRMRELAGNGTVVKFPCTSAGGRENFAIEVWDRKKNRDLSMWSEGESWRTAFAILLALRETMLARTGCKLSILLVDDPLGGLDKTGMKVFVEILRSLSGVAETILVAVPREDLVEGDVCIHVVRENDVSKVTVNR